MTFTWEEQRAKAVEDTKSLARKLLAQGWGHDESFAILSDALFAVEEEEHDDAN